MYFDSHAHLNDRRFDGDREEVLQKMAENKVAGMMNVGCSLRSSRDCIALAEQHEGIFASVGSHPDHADEVCDEILDAYRKLARHPKVKAIGEIGLDYHYEDIPREIQKLAFRRQLQLARELDMPVVVHEREAHGDALDILADFPDVTGVFHCYSGSWEMAQILLKKGWYLGFTGVITFKNARKSHEVLKMMPADRILIETDCPYMAPVPHRGKRCHSGLLPHTLAALAEIRGISVEEAAELTLNNAKRFYGID